jgi:hypothetical protein
VTQFAFAHAMQVVISGAADERFQNFFMHKNLENHLGPDGTRADFRFLPFGFSGVTLNRTGDGMEASLVLPNNTISRAWGKDAVEKNYQINVQVLIIEDSDQDTGPTQTHSVVHTYTGVVTGGQWDNVSLNLELSSVLDAVGTDVPMRSLTQKLVGNLPISNSVRLQ